MSKVIDKAKILEYEQIDDCHKIDLHVLKDALFTAKYYIGVSEALKTMNDRYSRALLNLADYVLTGEYKREALKLLGLLDEEAQ